MDRWVGGWVGGWTYLEVLLTICPKLYTPSRRRRMMSISERGGLGGGVGGV